MESKDSLGDRMKAYEAETAPLDPFKPIVLRLDGKAFSSWAQMCNHPYDRRLHDLFDECTKFLVGQTNALVGYTQSDEITLILPEAVENGTQVFFGGKRDKLNSVVASLLTAKFNDRVEHYLRGTITDLAFFDCRAFNVPVRYEAVNALIWREQDAARNSVQMLARSLYSHKEVDGKKIPEMLDMITAAGGNWARETDRFRFGAYFKRKEVERKFTFMELQKLPQNHEARRNPDLMVKRTAMERLEISKLVSFSPSEREELIYG